MGTLVFFPTERFGAVTRATEQPHAVERLASWLRKVAHIRASAALGCDATLELAPNIVPMRRCSRSDVVAAAIVAYCKDRHYSPRIVNDAIRAGVMRIKEGKSSATAIQSGKMRADFLASGPTPPRAA